MKTEAKVESKVAVDLRATVLESAVLQSLSGSLNRRPEVGGHPTRPGGRVPIQSSRLTAAATFSIGPLNRNAS